VSYAASSAKIFGKPRIIRLRLATTVRQALITRIIPGSTLLGVSQPSQHHEYAVTN